MGQQNPYDPSSWNAPAGQPGPFGSGLPPTPPPQGIGFAPKALAVLGGVVAAGILVLALGSNLGHNASQAVGRLSATPTVSTHYIRVAISTRGLDETIYFKVVSTDSEKKAFVDGFQRGLSNTANVTAEVTDLSALPPNAVSVCEIKLPSSETLRSVQVYSVTGDNLSRDIAQAGCDAANASS